MNQEDQEMMAMFDRLPSWKKAKMMKAMLLILNNSQRLERLVKLHDSGQLSNDDLVRLI